MRWYRCFIRWKMRCSLQRSEANLTEHIIFHRTTIQRCAVPMHVTIEHWRSIVDLFYIMWPCIIQSNTKNLHRCYITICNIWIRITFMLVCLLFEHMNPVFKLFTTQCRKTYEVRKCYPWYSNIGPLYGKILLVCQRKKCPSINLV